MVRTLVGRFTYEGKDMLLTVDKEGAAVVDEDLGTLVDSLSATLLPRGSRLMKQNAVARDLRRGAHGCDIEVLCGLLRRVCPSGPDEVAMAGVSSVTKSVTFHGCAKLKRPHSLLESFSYCDAKSEPPPAIPIGQKLDLQSGPCRR